MTNKYPKSEYDHIKSLGEPAYISYDYDNQQDRDKALTEASKSFGSFSAVASRSRNFENLATKTDGRPGLSWSDYDYFRFSESVPTKFVDILTACNNAYRQVGLIRNIIDLMGDFACQGIRVVHPNVRIERFYEAWWHRVQGKSVSERFLNYLFRLANNVVKMKTAKVNKSKRSQMMRSLAAVDLQVTPNPRFNKGEIPWAFNFFDPRSIDVVGGPLANFVGDRTYLLKLPSSMRKFLQRNQSDERFKKLISQLPSEIRRAVENPSSSFILPPERTFVYHYKKDDWDTWALPIIFSCLDDIITLRKLKLADRAALDGATSKIRVWKLGSLEHKLAPNAAAAETLADMLGNHVGGGTVDFVWDPAIDLLESDTDIHNFLGEEKYKPTLKNIYECLGVPPTLTGSFGASGTTNNLISLKTLTERLKYARGKLKDFWREQLQIVQLSMGFRFPAQLEFDFMNLDDPATINQLLINLADRGIVSDEFIQRHLGTDTTMERVRLRREEQNRDKGKMSPKASPYHDPDKLHHLKRTFAQVGGVTPSELGIELEDRKKGEKTVIEQRQVQKQTKAPGVQLKKPVGQPGRPPGTRDSGPRKPKQFTPKVRARLYLWAEEAQDKIAKIGNLGLLKVFGKKTMRSLTKAEFELSEKLKFEALCRLEPFSPLDDKHLVSAITSPLSFSFIHRNFANWLYDEDLGVEDIRKLRCNFYVNLMESLDG